MQFGFSIVGVVFLAMLFIPNIRWAKNQPLGYEEISRRENKVLLTFERIGQALATCSAVVFVCPQGFSLPWLLWLLAAFLLMLLYEVAWARYFKGGEKLDGMYQSLGPIPVPIASLPVAALVLLGIWCQSPIAVIAALILGIGHIGIHLGHLHELTDGELEQISGGTEDWESHCPKCGGVLYESHLDQLHCQKCGYIIRLH